VIKEHEAMLRRKGEFDKRAVIFEAEGAKEEEDEDGDLFSTRDKTKTKRESDLFAFIDAPVEEEFEVITPSERDTPEL
jgi:uncharacterized protein YrzB (UPF0473 family)